jgi:hypothetical protein
MDDGNSPFGRTVLAWVCTILDDIAQETTAKPTIVAAIAKMMCFRMLCLRLGG